jgi:phosphoesterase RecJ-like protein
MDKLTADSLRKLIEKSSDILIIAHKNPDGDAMGSSLGLQNFLKSRFIHSVVMVPDSPPGFLRFLYGAKNVMYYDLMKDVSKKKVEKADLIFCLDFNSLKRIDELGAEVAKSRAPIVMIDHHPFPDDFAKYSYHRTNVSSTSELVFEFCRLLFPGSAFNGETATCLYTGIVTDTGSFRHNVHDHTHEAAGELIRSGADMPLVNKYIFDSNSLNRTRMLGFALSEKLTWLPEYHTAYIALSAEEMKRFDHKKGDTEGFVNQVLSVDGVGMAVLFTEQNEKLTKLSFRSSGDFAVNGIASEYFKGGGHKNAAGGTFEGPVDAAVQKLLSVLPQVAPKSA